MISSSNRLLASKTMSLDGTNNAINLWDDSFKAASSQQAGFSTSARESAKNDHMVNSFPQTRNFDFLKYRVLSSDHCVVFVSDLLLARQDIRSRS